MPVTVGSLCTGYGGLEIGLALADPDVVPVWHAEVDPDASAVLAAAFPDVPNLGSIVGRDWSATPTPDILTAGFPCQPVSAAGRQLADADPRWLWPAVADAIGALRPPVVLLENVRNIISIHKGRVHEVILNDLRTLGYACRWVVLGACAVDAAHHRHRWFLRGDLVAPDLDPPAAARLEVPACGAPRGKALPTPQARNGEGGDVASVLGGTRESGAKRAVSLGNAVRHALLPTPRASDGENGRGNPNQRGGRGDLMIGSAVQPQRFAQFAPAVERHASAFGAEPPEPVEANGNGNPRLSATFVEWMMGLPAGHVTTHAARPAALRILGNGAVPPQVAAAWRLLRPTQPMEERIMSDTNTSPEPDERGTETALAASRDALRGGSSVFAGILKVIEFHRNDECKHGMASAQLLRDVLGTIERAATEASRHQPKWRKSNGMPEFAEFNPPALRQLAALCRVYAGVDPITLSETVAPASEPDPTPDPITPVSVSPAPPVPGQAEAVAAIEEEVAREIREGVNGITDPPDPFDMPAPIDDFPEKFVAMMTEAAQALTSHIDAYALGIEPFDVPAPLSPGVLPNGERLDDIPF